MLFNNTNSPALAGKTALVTSEEPLAYSNHMTRLRVLHRIRSDFLAHYLHWLWMSGYFKTILNNHVNQASVASKRLLETLIIIPPLAQQQRIVAVVDECMAHIDSGTSGIKAARRRLLRLNEILQAKAVNGELPAPPMEAPQISCLKFAQVEQA